MNAGKVIFLTGIVAALAGCTAANGPWPMPTGYTYHNEEYKAPPGPEPVFRQWESKVKGGYEPPVALSTSFGDNEPAPESMAAAPVEAAPVDAMPMEEVALEEIAPESVPAAEPVSVPDDDALRVVADDLTGRLFAHFGKPVEPVYLAASPNTDPALDRALREALTGQGLKLATAPGMSPFVLTLSVTPLAGDTQDRSLLGLTLSSAGKTVTDASALYSLAKGGL